MDKKIKTHDELMNVWQARHEAKGYKDFIADGIIDEVSWGQSKIKVAFLLKEAYGTFGSLTDHFKEWGEVKYQLWHNVSYWLYGMHHVWNEKVVPDFTVCKSEETSKERYQYFLSTAIINIKKSNGTSSTEKEDLMKYLKEDADLIKTQLELIDPDVIICGGTYEAMMEMYGLDYEKGKLADWTYRWRDENKDRLVIDFIHPAAQIYSAMSYYTITSMYAKAIERMKAAKIITLPATSEYRAGKVYSQEEYVVKK